jgi:hypothetical protein
VGVGVGLGFGFGLGFGPGVEVGHVPTVTLAGALVLAKMGVSVMSAASLKPRSSVTTTRSTTEPPVGAVTVAVAVLAATIPGGGPLALTTVHS